MKDYKVKILCANGEIREEIVRAYRDDIAISLCRYKYLQEGETIMYAILF